MLPPINSYTSGSERQSLVDRWALLNFWKLAATGWPGGAVESWTCEISEGLEAHEKHEPLKTDRTPNLPTKIIPTKIMPTKIRWLNISRKFPMGLGIPPLEVKILPESNPLKSRILVRRWAAVSRASRRAEARRRLPAPSCGAQRRFRGVKEWKLRSERVNAEEWKRGAEGRLGGFRGWIIRQSLQVWEVGRILSKQCSSIPSVEWAQRWPLAEVTLVSVPLGGFTGAQSAADVYLFNVDITPITNNSAVWDRDEPAEPSWQQPYRKRTRQCSILDPL